MPVVFGEEKGEEVNVAESTLHPISERLKNLK